MVRFDYTTVGHVTADIAPDGSARPGGTAFYSALQAARLGQRTLIITQGVAAEIEQLLAPYRSEFELAIRPAAHTTRLETAVVRGARVQRMLSWAGPIADDVALETSILHLAPIARESPRRWHGAASFVGLTAQGLVREWDRIGARVEHVALDPELLPRRCDAIVIAEVERESARVLFSGATELAGAATVVITAGSAPTELRVPGRAEAHVSVPDGGPVRDDVGAGDVFAGAFFVALAEGRAPASAVLFANAAAAVRIAGAGPDAIGEKAAIEARLRSPA